MKQFRGKKHIFFSKYTKNSLFKHYLKGLLSILLIPFILFYTVLFIYNLRSTEEAFKYSSTEVLSRSVTAMDTLFEVIYKNYEAINANSNVKTFLLDGYFLNNTAYNTYNYSAQIVNQLTNISISLNYIDSIHLYSKANDYFLSSVNSNFSSLFYDAECYDIYKNCQNSNCITARNLDTSNILTLCYIVNKGFENEGAVFFNIDIAKLMPTLTGINADSSAILLADKNGTPIMSSDNDLTKNISKAGKSSYGHYEIIKENGCVYNSTRLLHENFILIFCVDNYTYYTAFYPFMANNILYFIFILLALIIISFAGTLKLYNSISNAFAYIEMPAEDNGTYGEFVFLTKNMMSRVEGGSNAENTLADKIQKLKKYQALALQTQINPHFLFNSLNLISTFALESGKEDSPLVVIVDKLSDILRFCLNTKNYIIKIEEEIETTKKYIEIENIKHGNSIDFIFDIDENLYKYYTLKMIMQPIIENAITHGVKLLRNEKGVVAVSGKISGQNVVFSITNNGPAIKPEHLKELQNSLLSVNDIPENNHIGLRNVNQRIKLIFGDEYGCTINSEENKTTVTITIPIITKNNNDFTL